ncbi:MAG: hypothetical protein ABW208_05410 [Pyrinomonadaceae bacterium]
MFGLGKVFSGFFDSIGMGWMGSVLSLATNFMMGNWAGVAQDIFQLVSEFSNDSWTNRVDRYQPLGAFGRNSSFGDGTLSESRVSDLLDRAGNNELASTRAINLVFDEAHNNIRLRCEFDFNRQSAYSAGRM